MHDIISLFCERIHVFIWLQVDWVTVRRWRVFPVLGRSYNTYICRKNNSSLYSMLSTCTGNGPIGLSKNYISNFIWMVKLRKESSIAKQHHVITKRERERWRTIKINSTLYSTTYIKYEPRTLHTVYWISVSLKYEHVS